MVQLHCPIEGCPYVTIDGTEVVACALLAAHTPAHNVAPAPMTSGPKLERPKIDIGVTLEQWNMFERRWDVFVNGSGINPTNSSPQLFQCASEELGNNLLKIDANVTSKPTKLLLSEMKSLAVIAVARGVLRAELFQMRQERDESFRSYAARVRGKAETCSYTTKCTCELTINFTDIIVRDVLIAGIADLDIRREILGIDSVLDKSLTDVITLVESREMARNALPTSSSLDAMSAFKKSKNSLHPRHPVQEHPQTADCPYCKEKYRLFTEGRLGWNTKPHRQCAKCYKERRKRFNNKSTSENSKTPEVGGTFAQVSTINATISSINHKNEPRYVKLTHHIFKTGEWRKAQFLHHPKIDLTISVSASDYRDFGRDCPCIKPSKVSVMTDSGAQSCLWSMNGFLSAGFTKADLLPVSIELLAANKSPINIAGAIIVRLQGYHKDRGKKFSCASMVYVSEDANGFYLSCEAMIDLAIVPPNFPSVGAAASDYEQQLYGQKATDHHRALNAGCSEPSSNPESPCTCPVRTVVPYRPKELPYACVPSNNDRMKEWLLQTFASSTFNTCPHRPLPCMTGPPVEIHLKDNASPKAVHKPAPVPVHWQDQVYKDLLRDEALGVVEKVPYGEPVTWCHRMVVTRKHNGDPRRTVDLSPLNKHCNRETFASESPFHLARKIPKGTWKTVTDAWNGYHSVPLRESDRHLTTFITPFGRWRYTRAPQGFLSSGDGYNRRFEAILTDFERKERCVDDTIHYDDDLAEHWWRTIDLLILVGRSGIVLNPDKFVFAQKSIEFAGFQISESSIEPLPKYLSAIRDFPTPTSTTDIRSWFGLVNQVANYAQLRDIMTPFKPFLSPRCQFEWTSNLSAAFQSSKDAIIEAIRHGVQIFDPKRLTCLRPDWSHLGIGYFLLQKHCSCTSQLPDCCIDGWRITLAGSRFLSSAEQRYAPVEGEALAVAWSLEQTKYFTQGCHNLLVVTDHKPLVKIMGDRTLDEISNTRIFRLKQRTLPWSFKIAHMPGKLNYAADATSRHPSPLEDSSDHQKCAMDQAEVAITSAIRSETATLTTLSWERIASETLADPTMHRLLSAILDGFTDKYRANNDAISAFWIYRESLYVSDGVIIYQDRVVVPPALQNTVLQILHSAHQGVSAMQSRARAIVFWPGMTEDIKLTREKCRSCNKSAPSQAAMPTIVAPVPATPFESIFADFFDYAGHHYLVAGDRLSGWVEIFKSPTGTAKSGASGLISALRLLFSTFGVPEEISSDGGPEFSASMTADFLSLWEIHHRVSSAYYPQSNGRAEVAVKKAKRILMENIGSTGSLDNDNFLRAMLQIRNTPDPDCNISPAEIVFGRPIRDAFSFVNRCSKFSNPSVHPEWRKAWSLKEKAMRCRMTRTCEKLNEHTRQLPPLQVSDHVFIQNQHGAHPSKWDKSGKIIDVKPHNQYLVKVNGSGRVTVRNRRFLRKFTPAAMTVNQQPLQGTTANNVPSDSTSSDHSSHREHTQLHTDPYHDVTNETDSANVDTSETETTTPSPVKHIEDKDKQSDLITTTPAKITTPARITTPVPLKESTDRPRRQRKPRQLYVPETGQWQPK